ncbi:MAG TPA: type II secretion system protein GspE, partial [Deltaproteobacteria bacterium]|nr:type II secretion system protein GspE [Deltaproteobacteria bacterium]
MSQDAAAGRNGGGLDLGALLLGATRLTPEQLDAARQRQGETGRRLLEVLMEQDALPEEELLAALGARLGLPVLQEIPAGAVDDALVARVPIAFAKAHGLLPLRYDESGAVRIAISDPFDTGPLDDLRLLFDGADIAAELAAVRVIETAINQVYDRGPGSAAELAEEAATDLDTLADEISHQVPQDLIESADEAPIIKLVNSLLQQAVKERASDIHI